VRAYTLAADEFRSLAAGYGTGSALDVLARSQLSKRRLSIRAVADTARLAGPGIDQAAAGALELLQEAESAHPDAARAVLAHPHLDVWAADCLRALAAIGTATHRTAEAEARAAATVGHLGALAAAAAAHAGLRFDVTVPSRDGVLVLPTVGAVRGLDGSPVRVHGDGSALCFRTGSRSIRVVSPYTSETPHWSPQRHLTAVARGRSHTVTIEDLDPYRDCYQWKAMDRLAGADADRMRRLYQGAWELLVEYHPEHAAGILATLRSLIPLTPTRPDGSVSATSSRAFGALGVSLPEDPATLALLLLHEFQHMKLSALLDLVDLCRAGGTARHFAPWRPDPRPAGALLQGIYAHVGVVDFWRQRRLVTTGVAARTAQFEFALWRGQTALAIDSLLRSGDLTQLGVRFVRQLTQTLADWRGERVPVELETVARDTGLASMVRWRMSHWRPADGDLRRLADALRAARPCPPVAPALPEPSPPIEPAAPALVSHLRAAATGTARRTGPEPADAAYLAGRYEDAVHGYTACIERGEADGWVGLALALARLGWAGAAALARRPDLVRRLYIVADRDLTPAGLAAWLEPAISHGERRGG
jgi:HEXXH motif-containing protein